MLFLIGCATSWFYGNMIFSIMAAQHISSIFKLAESHTVKISSSSVNIRAPVHKYNNDTWWPTMIPRTKVRLFKLRLPMVVIDTRHFDPEKWNIWIRWPTMSGHFAWLSYWRYTSYSPAYLRLTQAKLCNGGSDLSRSGNRRPGFRSKDPYRRASVRENLSKSFKTYT